MKKKFLMCAAVGLAAAGLQAASFNWKSSGVAYGVDASSIADNGDYAAGTTVMRGKGTWSVVLALYDATSGALVGQSDATTVKFSTTGNRFGTSGVMVSEAAQGTSYKYVLTITGTQSDLTGRGEDSVAGFDYAAAILTTTIEGTIKTADMADTTLTSAVPTTWTVSGITALTPPTPPDPGDGPEPTSGLLLAVGGAMLALRRKRA